MVYLVTPPDETDWRLDPIDFEAALRARWTILRFHPNPEDDLFAFDFDVTVDGGMVSGAFGREGQMLSLEGDVFLCAQVAVWFRTLVPYEQPLLFYDEGYTGDVELIRDMTPEDLTTAYRASEAA